MIPFIGGTNLRLIKHIDRFSEDLDFDCTDTDDG
ncbi:MAG: nucleotidyl transferase AbiEii/AbiGii toxin family protein [Spirochaetaceae bacterium]|nr:nucleotidyl transferase AbiEii/AbiGii toxin family protein [Spirochaetaceae bacterium]